MAGPIAANVSCPATSIQVLLHRTVDITRSVIRALDAGGAAWFTPPGSAVSTVTVLGRQLPSFTFTAADGALVDRGPAADGRVEVITAIVAQPPAGSRNLGLTIPDCASATIGNAVLQTIDPDTPAASLVYTVDTLPDHGQLLLGGVALAARGTFTQQDLDLSRLSYQHGCASVAASDRFTFTVSDGSTPLPTADFIILIDPSLGDTDGDSVPNAVENAGPNGGDGNGDGVPDRRQPAVASLPEVAPGGSWATLILTGCATFTHVEFAAGGGTSGVYWQTLAGPVSVDVPCPLASVEILLHRQIDLSRSSVRTRGRDGVTWSVPPGTRSSSRTVLGQQLPSITIELVDGALVDSGIGSDGRIQLFAEAALPTANIPALPPLGRIALLAALAMIGLVVLRRI
jgi:hypothetical protein